MSKDSGGPDSDRELLEIASRLTNNQRKYLASVKGWVYASDRPSVSRALYKAGLFRVYRSSGFFCRTQLGVDVSDAINRAEAAIGSAM